MAIHWRELITIAAELAAATAHTDVSEEAYKRSSVNRAYYGAMHLAEAALLSMGIPQSDFDRQLSRWHVFIIDKFKDSTNKNERDIGVKLDDLRLRRWKADYNQNISDIDWDCRMSLRLAKELEGLLPAL